MPGSESRCGVQIKGERSQTIEYTSYAKMPHEGSAQHGFNCKLSRWTWICRWSIAGASGLARATRQAMGQRLTIGP